MQSQAKRSTRRTCEHFHAGNDLLEVELSGSGRPLWIPFVQAIVPRVELTEGWIGITPPPGLLELADEPDAKAQASD